jgi:hypothetical protein
MATAMAGRVCFRFGLTSDTGGLDLDGDFSLAGIFGLGGVFAEIGLCVFGC